MVASNELFSSDFNIIELFSEHRASTADNNSPATYIMWLGPSNRMWVEGIIQPPGQPPSPSSPPFLCTGGNLDIISPGVAQRLYTYLGRNFFHSSSLRNSFLDICEKADCNYSICKKEKGHIEASTDYFTSTFIPSLKFVLNIPSIPRAEINT